MEIPSQDVTFDQFLQSISVSYTEYIDIIRSSLTKSKIFFDVDLANIYLHPFPEKILRLQRANVDIQFVLDAYACCTYIVDYINKTDRGLGKMLDEVFRQQREGNKSVIEMLRQLSNTYYNNSEVSAQDAAYNLLRIAMSEASTTDVYIPTSPLDQRSRMLKSVDELVALGDLDSTDCFVHGIIEHYIKRPSSMEEINLAQFAA